MKFLGWFSSKWIKFLGWFSSKWRKFLGGFSSKCSVLFMVEYDNLICRCRQWELWLSVKTMIVGVDNGSGRWNLCVIFNQGGDCWYWLKIYMLKNLTLMRFVKISLRYVSARFYLFLNWICLKIKVYIFGKIRFVFKLDMFKNNVDSVLF